MLKIVPNAGWRKESFSVGLLGLWRIKIFIVKPDLQEKRNQLKETN